MTPVKLQHFAAYRPLCPLCRTSGAESPLAVDRVARGNDEAIDEGTLACPAPACAAKYPILDGIPILLADARGAVAGAAPALLARNDLSELAEDLIAECCGPGSAFDTVRQQLSSYAWDHYAEFDPADAAADPAPGAASRLLARGLALAGPLGGPALDLGCSAGRTTFDLATATGGLALGVDMNLAKLRLAADVLRTGRVRYPKRRVGNRYERREFDLPLDRRRVDFWACDAAALPFPDGGIGTAVSLNVLDSMANPAGHLRAVAAALRPGGRFVLACPYDWSPAVTPPEAWLGGTAVGDSEPATAAALAAAGFTVLARDADAPWRVRLHDRATVAYRCDLLVAGRETKTPGAPA